MIRSLGRLAFSRIYLFRKEVVLLWRAFWHPATPFHLKAATVLVALYLVSPFDLIPEFLPFVGLIDDVLIVPMVVSWIVRRLPVDLGGASDRRR